MIYTAKPLALALAVTALSLGSVVASAKPAPTINLFPTTVLENIKATSDSAHAMESNLEGVIQQMDQQYAAYKASKCEGSEADPGCSAIQRSISQSYIAMLDQLESELPAMEQAVQATKNSLEKSLRSQVGKKMSPRGLQRLLAGKTKDVRSLRNRTGRKGVGRMSQVFKGYHQLVSRNRGNNAIPAMAADIYLDSLEVLQFIGMTRQEIAAAKTEASIMDAYSGITPQMLSTVGNVKALLFGEVDGEGVPGQLIEDSIEIDANVDALIVD